MYGQLEGENSVREGRQPGRALVGLFRGREAGHGYGLVTAR